MKRTIVYVLLVAGCLAQNLKPQIYDFVGNDSPRTPKPSQTRSVLVSPVGDIRAILGPQGKSIVVNDDGSTVAVIYGDPTNNPDNPMEIYITYSTDGGTSFLHYGAFSPELKRIYPGVDAVPDFSTVPGHVFFTWQESPNGYNTGDQKVILDENVPSSPSFSTPISLPQATTIFPWMTCISVAPDNSAHLIASGWSYLNGGNGDIVCWISDDGGYSWTDPILMGDNLPAAGTASPHVRQGTGGYVAATYHNLYNWSGSDIEFPYFIESTDGGNTWLPRVPLPVPYASGAAAGFWWHELDLEVINNEPWCVHTDLGADSMWLFHGTGSPGAWTWEVFNVRQIGTCSTWVAGVLYLCYPSQYPSIAYDATSGMIIVSYKGYYYHGDTIDWSDMNGAHVGGIYTFDDGATWTVAGPLQQVLNNGDIAWNDWNATETAHLLVNDGSSVMAYTVWVHQTELNAYFEKGFPRPGIEYESQGNQVMSRFIVTPSVCRNICQVAINMKRNENVSLIIYDAIGRNVETVFNGNLVPGNHKIPINTSHLANGTYFLVLKTSSLRQTAKIIKAH